MIKQLFKETGYPDKRIFSIFILIPLILACIHYLGNVDFLISFFKNIGFNSVADKLRNLCYYGQNSELNRLIIWILVVDTFYLVVPVVFIKLVLKESLKGYALSFKLEKNSLKLYLLMLCFMIPLVIFFSGTQSFQDRYPFYGISRPDRLWPNFWIWELFYFSQFFAWNSFLGDLW